MNSAVHLGAHVRIVAVACASLPDSRGQVTDVNLFVTVKHCRHPRGTVGRDKVGYTAFVFLVLVHVAVDITLGTVDMVATACGQKAVLSVDVFFDTSVKHTRAQVNLPVLGEKFLGLCHGVSAAVYAEVQYPSTLRRDAFDAGVRFVGDAHQRLGLFNNCHHGLTARSDNVVLAVHVLNR